MPIFGLVLEPRDPLARNLQMRQFLVLFFGLTQFWASVQPLPAQDHSEDFLRRELIAHATPLHGAGEALLLDEARTHE
jgi:hypothetical protein